VLYYYTARPLPASAATATPTTDASVDGRGGGGGGGERCRRAGLGGGGGGEGNGASGGSGTEAGVQVVVARGGGGGDHDHESTGEKGGAGAALASARGMCSIRFSPSGLVQGTRSTRLIGLPPYRLPLSTTGDARTAMNWRGGGGGGGRPPRSRLLTLGTSRWVSARKMATDPAATATTTQTTKHDCPQRLRGRRGGPSEPSLSSPLS